MTVTSDLKIFGLESGRSSGSSISMSFEVEEEQSQDLTKRIYAIKFDLDKKTLAMEFLRGSMLRSEYDERLLALKTSFGKLLGDQNDTANSQGNNSESGGALGDGVGDKVAGSAG